MRPCALWRRQKKRRRHKAFRVHPQLGPMQFIRFRALYDDDPFEYIISRWLALPLWENLDDEGEGEADE